MSKKTTTYKATRTFGNGAWKTDMPFPPEVIAAGEMRGTMETRGPWSIISKYTALAMEHTDENLDTSHYKPFQTTAIIYGVRSLNNPRECGHDLEGTVSINGQKLRAFTSSHLFEVNGELIDVAILYVCRKDKK